MLSLYLLRHAKSDWGDFSLRDEDRPLSSRGQKASHKIGHYLRNQNISPDRVICSPARRTRETLSIIETAYSNSLNAAFDASIYWGGACQLQDLISAQNNSIHSLMIIGHNPSLHELAMHLISDGPPSKLANLCQKLPTGSLIHMALNIDHFSDIFPGCARLIEFMRPTDLASAAG